MKSVVDVSSSTALATYETDPLDVALAAPGETEWLEHIHPSTSVRFSAPVLRAVPLHGQVFLYGRGLYQLQRNVLEGWGWTTDLHVLDERASPHGTGIALGASTPAAYTIITIMPSAAIILPADITPVVPRQTRRPLSAYLLIKDHILSSAQYPSAGVERETLSIFAGLQTEELEDGMTNALGERVVDLVEKYNASAIMALASIISSEKVAPEVLSHSLRWLGRMKSPGSFRARLWLLRHSLLSSSPVIRDGASLGLAALGSPLAVPSLRAAIQRERSLQLRKDMKQVLDYLESKR